MIITCPHCQTKYQVTYETIGSVGRKVQCAHCQQAWKQRPLDKETTATPDQKRASAAITEDGLDEAMATEEHAVAAEVAKRLALEKAAEEAQRRAAAASKTEAAVLRKRQKAFSKRQNAIVADLPVARLRRTVRVVGAVLMVAVLAAAYFGRVAVVQRFPAMAGVYESVGLGVNVVGLDFSNVTTLQSLRDGKEVLAVSAQIVGLMPNPVLVPAVVVTLLDRNGQGIYEWSVTPAVRDLMVGERATFDTQLTLPPGEAAHVRLSFAGGPSRPLGETAGVSAARQAPAGHAEPASHAETDQLAAPAAPTEHSTPEQH